jgi:4-amino-4-deoxy-L-arabinose transferase-like glycosyltransferase
MIAKVSSEDGKQHVLVGLTLIFLFLNLYVYVDLLPLTGEEDRRCIIAQEMLLSGDFVHPSVYNVPYYKKPPMHNWIIALVNLHDGVVDRGSARAVSIATLLIMGLSMYLFLLRKHAEGAMTGFLVVTTNYLMMCEYGNLAETDMLVTLFTFLSFILYFVHPTHLLCIFLSSLFMGAGILTKGLSPFFFYPAILLVALTTQEKKGERLAYLLVHFLLSWLLPALWLWHFSAQGDLQGLVSRLTSEVSQRSQGRVLAWIVHLVHYPAKVFCVLLPWSLVLVLAFKRKNCQDEVCRAAFLMFAISFVILTLSPDAKDRYLMPAFPAFAIFCAYSIDPSRAPEKRLQKRVISMLSLGSLLIALLCAYQGYLLQSVIFVLASIVGVCLRSRRFGLIPFCMVLVSYILVMYMHGLFYHRSHYRFDHEPGALAVAELIREPLPVVARKGVSNRTGLFLQGALQRPVYRFREGQFDSYYYLSYPAWVKEDADILLEIPYPRDRRKDLILQRVCGSDSGHDGDEHRDFDRDPGEGRSRIGGGAGGRN